MTVRAKFKVAGINQVEGWGTGEHKVLHTITLRPVVGGSTENDKFYAATPSGEVQLGVVGAVVAGQFEIGKTFYLDFTPAE
jgi:hypothetical protein